MSQKDEKSKDPNIRVKCLFIVGALIGGVLAKFMLDEPEVIIQYFGFLLTIFTIWRATIHFRAYHDMERRKLAIVEGDKTKHTCDKALTLLKKTFDFHAYKFNPIPVEEVHKAICCVKEGELVPAKKGSFKYKLDCEGDGHKVDTAITELLNGFEYMAVGVYLNIFDRHVIRALYCGNFCKIYANFKLYIEHFNKEMYPERDGRIWINFAKLAQEFMKENEKTAEPDKKEPTG